ncbi:MAG TPA: hypothetical protein VMI73_06260 [Trebonia sp.]|nr:hypothetical protein [Trebonia sp.]
MAEAHGTVVADACLDIERNLAFAAVPGSVIEAELRRLAGQGAECLAVVCTNLLGVAGGLAGESWTVLDSVLATVWHAARLTGSYAGRYADCYRSVLARLAGPGGDQ